MTDRHSDEPRGDEVDRRDAVADRDALEHARGRRGAREHRLDLQPGTRAWRTDHTEIALITTEVRTGAFVQAPLASDDLEIVARMLTLQAVRLRQLAERR